MSTPKGIRNKNPGNLVDSGIDWRGKVGTDGRFIVFDKMSNGVRALVLDLTNDFYVDGKRTIRQLINEFAPPSENKTGSYVNHVSSVAGIDADYYMEDLRPYLTEIVEAIIKHENGRTIREEDKIVGINEALKYRGLV